MSQQAQSRNTTRSGAVPPATLLTAAFAFILLLPGAEADGCDRGQVVIGDNGPVDVADGECDDCYAVCLERADEMTCRDACASGSAEACYTRCLERGGDDASCRDACDSTLDCDACHARCLGRGEDEQLCRDACDVGATCRQACADL